MALQGCHDAVWRNRRLRLDEEVDVVRHDLETQYIASEFLCLRLQEKAQPFSDAVLEDFSSIFWTPDEVVGHLVDGCL